MSKFYYKEIKDTTTQETQDENAKIKTIPIIDIVNQIKSNINLHILHPKNKIPINRAIFDGIVFQFRHNGVLREILTKAASFSILDRSTQAYTFDGREIKIPNDLIGIRKFSQCIIYTYDDGTWEIFNTNLGDKTLNKVNIIDEIKLNDKHDIIPMNNDTHIYVIPTDKSYILPHI